MASFEPNGKILIRQDYYDWTWYSSNSYKPKLMEALGPGIPLQKMWNPDAVLNVDVLESKIKDETNVAHQEMIDRVDKAAALQLFFEDMIFHVMEDAISVTSATKVIWTGGTALNCITSMHLLDHFNQEYYSRVLGMKNSRMHLWIPPVPGDSGTYDPCHTDIIKESH